MIRTLFLILCFSLLQACATSLPWPGVNTVSPSTVSPNDVNSGSDFSEKSRADVMAMVAGRYGHYDVVAYEDFDAKPVMRTFVISYGFTEFLVENNQLIQRDRFCHAEHKMSFKTVRTRFSDEATQAIIPEDVVVDLSFKNGQWQIVREATPTLLGIKGDPNLPLSRNKNDPNIEDSDGDGRPGVTVQVIIGGLIKGKIYITRREIFKNVMTVETRDRIRGTVIDSSEQFILGANLKMLSKPSDPVQHPDPKMNPLLLTRLPDEIQTCNQLMDSRDTLFPPSPEFF